MAAGVFAASQVHEAIVYRAAGSRVAAPRRALPLPIEAQSAPGDQAVGSGRFDRLVADVAGAGAKPVDANAAALPAPPGAARVSAFEMADASVIARLRWEGTREQAVDFYRVRMSLDGFTLLSDGVDAQGWRNLTFDSLHMRMVVALRNDPKQATMLDIALTAMPVME